MSKRKLVGIVVSTKNQNQSTLVVKVERKFQHSLYKKIVKKYKKYQVHSENSTYEVGDAVQIIESSPISKNKKWRVVI